MFVGDRLKQLTNPGPLAVADDIGTLDVKSPETFAGKIVDMCSMLETSCKLMP